MHPIQSPQNRFCVLTLDPETLPAIATTLIDVLFYSYRWALFAPCLFVLTPLFPVLCPTTSLGSLSSATVCPVLCHGFLAACDTRVPLTDVQGRFQCSCHPFLQCELRQPRAMGWSGPPPAPESSVFGRGKILSPVLPPPDTIRRSGPSDKGGKEPREGGRCSGLGAPKST